MNILIIDDDKLMLASMSIALKSKGYSVITATDGMEAFDLIERGYDLDLIISDIMMPELSGITLVRLMKQRNCHVPLILMSSLNYAGIIIQKFGLEGYDVIVKPIDYNQLLKKIEHYVKPVPSPR